MWSSSVGADAVEDLKTGAIEELAPDLRRQGFGG